MPQFWEGKLAELLWTSGSGENRIGIWSAEQGRMRADESDVEEEPDRDESG